MKRSEILFTLFRLPVDILALFLAFFTAYFLRDQFVLFSQEDFGPLAPRFQYFPGSAIISFDQYLRYVGFIIPIMIVIFALTGLYVIRRVTPWYTQLAHIIIGVSGGEFAILLLFLLKRSFFLPRSTVLYSWVLAILFVYLGRYGLQLLQQLLLRYNIGSIRVGIIGKNGLANAVIRQFQKKSYAAYQLSFQMDTPEVAKVSKKLSKNDIDELIVVSEGVTNDDLIALRNICLEQHIAFGFVPSLFTELPCSYEVDMVGNLPRVEVRPTPLEGWGKVLKRLFDIIGALFFIVLFSPIFLLIAIWLKLSSPGPLIYKHRRIGYHHQPIDIWKFRTMKYEYCSGDGYKGNQFFAKLLAENPDLQAEWKTYHKLKNDPRVSLPGKLLRKTSLDELPQFINVLFGSLSLVGPRPIVQDEVEKYGEKARILFTVKPGVTGLWQVSGRNDVSYEERIRFDAEYIEHWHLWKDIVILIKTAKALLKRGNKGGAY